MREVEGYRLERWGTAPVWKSFPIEEPGPDEVLVEVEACGVGATVLNCMSGQLADAPELLPLTPGHEVVGRIAEVGEGVTSHAAGDRVMAYFYLSCFRCRACLAGRESRCERMAGWYGVHRDGGYAPLSVLPAGNAVPLMHDIPASQATVVPDAVATPVHVCRSQLRLGPGDRVAVIGAGGGVGVHMLQVAAACGARVAGLERTEDKLALVEELGALPVDSRDFRTELEALDGEADAVIDLVGTRDSLSWGLAHLSRGGRLCVLTTFPEVSFQVHPRALVFKESVIIGSRYASRAELIEAARMVADGAVKPVVGAAVPPDDVAWLHRELRTGTLRGRGALLWRP